VELLLEIADVVASGGALSEEPDPAGVIVPVAFAGVGESLAGELLPQAVTLSAVRAAAMQNRLRRWSRVGVLC
jgi:hypothetical protein